MSTIEERLAVLEERVFTGHNDKIKELTTQMKDVNAKLTTLIVLLCGNFGLAAIKAYLELG